MKPRIDLRTLLAASALYVFLVLFFTAVAMYVSPASSQIGTLRSLSTIPGHELAILGFAILLGLAAPAIQRRLDFTLTLMILAFSVLTDVDHLPSALGVLQPIRPAHSVFFAGSAALLLLLVLRRPDVSLAALSGFSAHLAVDTGVFPLFSPFSFVYYSLNSYRVYLVVFAVAFSLLAGLLARRAGSGRALRLKPVETTAAPPDANAPSGPERQAALSRWRTARSTAGPKSIYTDARLPRDDCSGKRQEKLMARRRGAESMGEGPVWQSPQ